ncbi:SDR family oxidoreductase, partial [Microbacteriaceae bacterium K1510]|nr:SDR family oxidoreductase [Microbacteriaceae bacterium K1510]
AVEMDVTCEESVAQAMRTLNAKVGAIDILVNNAGQAETAPFLKTDLAMWDRMLRVNLIGTYLVTRSVLPGMVEAKGGRIINVASSAGLVGYSYVSAYVAAKHAVIGLTRSLALEVVSHGITVNAVCPGYTDTPLVDRAIEAIAHKTGRTPSEAHASIVRTNPLGRLMRPGEVADAVSWLAGSGAAAITGQAISITGGEVMVG